MKKETKCNECDNTLYSDTYCDTCGKQLTRNGYNILGIEKSHPIEIRWDDIELDFCGFKCILQWILGELRKGETK